MGKQFHFVAMLGNKLTGRLTEVGELNVITFFWVYLVPTLFRSEKHVLRLLYVYDQGRSKGLTTTTKKS